jgi:hypothetical protein
MEDSSDSEYDVENVNFSLNSFYRLTLNRHNFCNF